MRAKEMIPLCKGDHEWCSRWAQICIEADRKEDQWIAELRKLGVKAAHPDDGWVDRKGKRNAYGRVPTEDSVYFAYPQFNDGVNVGDKIALGWPSDKTRIVTVTNIRDVGMIAPMRRYFFTENK